MKHIEEFEKTSKKMLNKIKKDLSHLIIQDDLKTKSIEEVRLEMKNVHEQLYDLESSIIRQKNPEYDQEEIESNLMMRKKIIIKNIENQSRSFKAWIFNNSDV